MRVDVKKYLFIGSESHRGRFFKKAQQYGIIDFIPGTTKEVDETYPIIQSITDAIKVLRHEQPTEQEDTEEYDLAPGIAQHIVELHELVDALQDESKQLVLEMTRVRPLGRFEMEDIRYIHERAHKVIQFYVSRKGLHEDSFIPESLLYLTSDDILDYYMAINERPSQFDHMIEMIVDKPLGELEKEYEILQKRMDDVQARIRTYVRYNKFLHHALVFYMNKYNLEKTGSRVSPAMENALFTVEGWVPTNKQEELQQLLVGEEVLCEEIAIEETDAIPTCLQNTGMHRVGEDLVHIYDTPSHTDKDPSMWILFFFSLFFAFIIGDGGYGLIFLGMALWIRYKVPHMKSAGKRFMKLFFTLSFACILWGLMTTSFFGINIPANSPLRKVSLMSWLAEKKADFHLKNKDSLYQEWLQKYPAIAQAKNGKEMIEAGVSHKDGVESYDVLAKLSDHILMELALLIGILHISLGFLRYLNRNWSGIGWVIFMIGCYLYFPSYLGATSMLYYVFGIDQKTFADNGLYLIAGGIGIAMFLAILRHKIFGLLEGMNLIQVFADVLSYLRLYALALSGAIVTATLNDFAASVPFVVGAVLLLIGHATNIALATMGGVIHGLRLNFLEWYHYSFEGGGKKFNPLRLLAPD